MDDNCITSTASLASHYAAAAWRLALPTMIRFILVQNRQGKTRLSKFYVPYDDDEKIRLRGEVHRLIAPRDQKYQSNFVEVSPIALPTLSTLCWIGTDLLACAGF